MAAESESRRAVAAIWVILFIAVGAAILAYSAGLGEHSRLKPILESTGDGLMLLGLIDLFFQTRVISWLTRPTEVSKLHDQWMKVKEDLEAANRKLDEYNLKNQLGNVAKQTNDIAESVEEIKKDVHALKARLP